MDNLYIKITRLSDSSKFEMGAGYDWLIAQDGLENFGTINNTLEYVDNAISDGGIITNEHVANIDRTISAIYRHKNNMEVARKEMLSFFNVKDTFRVQVTYGTRNVFADGKIYKFVCNPSHLVNGALQLTITFMFANPFWKSVDNFGKNIAQTRGMTAFPYLCSATDKTAKGTTGGVFNFAQVVELYNDGDIDTSCKIVFKASDTVQNPKIIINGEYVRVIDTMEANDEIVMDFSATPPTVKKNDVNYIGHCDRTSSFDDMILAKGDNEASFTADNGSGSLAVTIYYYKQYGAI